MSEKIYFYNLPVYNATRILYTEIKLHTNKTSRDERAAFVIPVMKKINDMMVNFAYMDDENIISMLDKNIKILVNIQINIRNWFELKVITKKGFAAITNKSAQTMKQLMSWKKHLENEIDK